MGPERAAAPLRFANIPFPFVAIEVRGPPYEDMVKWIGQDPVFVKEQLAKMEPILARGEAFGIGEIFTLERMR